MRGTLRKDVTDVTTDFEGTYLSDDTSSIGKNDILSREGIDPVLGAKMHLVNNAIDEIGFTGYHWKLFCLNGFGYAVDSQILLIQSIIAGKAALEFNPGFRNGMTIAVYVGMLVVSAFHIVDKSLIEDAEMSLGSSLLGFIRGRDRAQIRF